MSGTDRTRARPDRLEAVRETAGAERYRRRQLEWRRGGGRVDAATPLEYDESGFPIPQRRPGFAARMARLLTPS